MRGKYMRLKFHPIKYVKEKLRNVQAESQQRRRFDEFKKMLVGKDPDLEKAALVYDVNKDFEVFQKLLSDGQSRVRVRTVLLLRINAESGKDISSYLNTFLDILFQNHVDDVNSLVRDLSRFMILNDPDIIYSLSRLAVQHADHRSTPAKELLAWTLGQEKLRPSMLELIICDLRFSSFGDAIYLTALMILKNAASKDQEVAKQAVHIVHEILNSDKFQLEMAGNTPSYVHVITTLAGIMQNAGITIDDSAATKSGVQ